MKRQMMKGYSHPNSPHPSQHHLTPDHTFDHMAAAANTKLGFPGQGMQSAHNAQGFPYRSSE